MEFIGDLFYRRVEDIANSIYRFRNRRIEAIGYWFLYRRGKYSYKLL
jgi:hypothetical protein